MRRCGIAESARRTTTVDKQWRQARDESIPDGGLILWHLLAVVLSEGLQYDAGQYCEGCPAVAQFAVCCAC